MRTKAILSIVLSVSLASFLILLTLSGILLFLSSRPSNPHLDKSEPKLYQMTEVNPFSPTKLSKKGFVRLPNEIKNEDFISYFNEKTGSSTIITDFGNTNYKCSGSCFCNEENRRNSGHLLSRGLSILFSAFSVSVAIKIAEKTFNDQCEHKFSSTCHSENINSEVESCEVSETSEDEKEGIPSKKDGENRFLCTGHCIYMDDSPKESHRQWVEKIGPLFYQEFLDVGLRNVGLCEGLSQEKTIEVLEEELIYLTSKNEDEPRSEEERVIAAKVKFSVGLIQFCNENGLVKLDWLSDTFRKNEEEENKKFENNFEKYPEKRKEMERLLGKGWLKNLLRLRKVGRPFCYGLDSEPTNSKNIQCVEI